MYWLILINRIYEQKARQNFVPFPLRGCSVRVPHLCTETDRRPTKHILNRFKRQTHFLPWSQCSGEVVPLLPPDLRIWPYELVIGVRLRRSPKLGDESHPPVHILARIRAIGGQVQLHIPIKTQEYHSDRREIWDRHNLGCPSRSVFTQILRRRISWLAIYHKQDKNWGVLLHPQFSSPSQRLTSVRWKRKPPQRRLRENRLHQVLPDRRCHEVLKHVL